MDMTSKFAAISKLLAPVNTVTGEGLAEEVLKKAQPGCSLGSYQMRPAVGRMAAG